jgi:hypothetical protein
MESYPLIFLKGLYRKKKIKSECDNPIESKIKKYLKLNYQQIKC